MFVRDSISFRENYITKTCELIYKKEKVVGYKIISNYNYSYSFGGNSQYRNVLTLIIRGQKGYVYNDYKDNPSKTAYRNRGSRASKEYIENCIGLITDVFTEENSEYALNLFKPRLDMITFYKLGPKVDYKHPRVLIEEAKELKKEKNKKEDARNGIKEPVKTCNDPTCPIIRQGRLHKEHLFLIDEIVYI